MTRAARIALALASGLFLTTYRLPLWEVRLGAPQYPEGLGMRIHVHTVRGIGPHDLEKINNLNHYIGMKRIEPDAIPELRWMPAIVAALAVGGLGVAAWGRRRPLYAYAGVVAVVLAAGLYDFWRWEYDYGHDLDHENAIIKVPGMSYQPPLIGTKRLLNFTATSLPAAGGWAVIAAAATIAGVTVTTAWRAGRRRAAAAVGVVAVAAGCAAGPEPVRLGETACAHCRMSIVDGAFTAQVRTAAGRALWFDSIECAASFVATGERAGIPPRAVWVADSEAPTTWLAAERAVFVRSAAIRSPMGGGLLAFRDSTRADAARQRVGGDASLLDWAAVKGLPPVAGG